MKKMGDFLKNEPGLFLYWVIVVSLYSFLSLFRHWHFESSAFDLGMADQALWHYSRLEIPVDSLGGMRNVLGDHFNPLVAVLTPLYWLTSRVESILVAQALLLMLPIFPIFLFTEKRLGRIPAYLFAGAYSVFWGIQLAAQFDFHDVSLAVPAISFALYFADTKRWKLFFATVFLLTMAKEDMCLLAVFIGIYLILRGYPKKGIFLAVFGSIQFWFEIRYLIPFFCNPGLGYVHWTYSQLGSGPLEALKTCLFHPWTVLKLLFSNQTKIVTMTCIFAPFLFLAFFSPMVVLTFPLVCERMLSDNSSFWILAYHYTAVISPVIAMASADGLFTLSGKIKDPGLRKKVITATSLFIAFLSLAVLPKMPLRRVAQISYYRLTASDLTGLEALRAVPPNSSVLAQDTIVPHLTHRLVIHDITPQAISNPMGEDYIIACRDLKVFFLQSYQDIEVFLKKRQEEGYHEIFNKNGWVVLKKNGLDQ